MTMEMSVADLKKLADKIREYSCNGEYCPEEWADALDAYADAQEPVAWRYRVKGDQFWNFDDSTDLDTGYIEGGEIEPLYAAPPQPSVSVSRSALVSAYSELFNNDDPTALRALGINVTETDK